MLEMVLRYIADALHLVRKWRELMEFFDGFLKDGMAYLNAKEHDNLLVDGETFSRSRKYFCTLSCLSELILYINNAIH
jgi:hypothetical protein